MCDCPLGYDGTRCEKCIDGYIGNPLLGTPCKLIKCDHTGSLKFDVDFSSKECLCKV